jgi:hypothetical protein
VVVDVVPAGDVVVVEAVDVVVLDATLVDDGVRGFVVG